MVKAKPTEPRKPRRAHFFISNSDRAECTETNSLSDKNELAQN